MNHRTCMSVFLAAAALLAVAQGQEDPGRSETAMIKVAVFYATNGDPKAAGERFPVPDAATVGRMRAEDRLRFAHYRALGQDVQPLFRSYENWAQPLKPSDEILVRFEARAQPTASQARIDLELWLSRQKILKTDVTLERGRSLFVLGPAWRGGNLIIAVSLDLAAD